MKFKYKISCNDNMNSQNLIKNNSLYTKQKCPKCQLSFMHGFDDSIWRKCPACKNIFNHDLSRDVTNSCLGNNCGSRNTFYGDNYLLKGSHKNTNAGPALMSDGRFITNYNSSNELTETMRKLNGVRNPNEFRNFMQKHGNKLIDAERKHIHNKNISHPNIACSEGWYDLWTKNHGNWGNLDKTSCGY
ncbi:Zn-finger domain-containing protein [Cotonvirus japonicus]|uniref:Zn-finger domain-containing protein n=1 Tax=Cotonvirus japonicus TaxID=2811091 RepID=A0ABM7NSC2_9VIRU|nr:Zn-finger domain-containing protein [Cotonvirus japonicus]BCS83053.1 Zn-finger domain-containing protein [Cotonvirus japonicus]